MRKTSDGADTATRDTTHDVDAESSALSGELSTMRLSTTIDACESTSTAVADEDLHESASDLDSQFSAIAKSSGKTIDEVRDVYEQAIAKKRAYEEAERVQRVQKKQFEELMPHLCKKIEEFRDRVDSLTLDSFAQSEKDLLDFMTTFYRSNRHTYGRMMPPVMATYLFWQSKRFLLLLRDRTVSDSDDEKSKEEARRLDTERFELPQQTFLDEFYLDMAASFERQYYAPLRLLRYEDMLYPTKYEAWRQVVPRPVHEWLAQAARNLLKDFDSKQESGEFEENGVSADEIHKWRMYLETIASGTHLPWGYVSEEEADDPRETLDYMAMLSPDNAYMFERTISIDDFALVKQRADAQLAALRQLPDNVRQQESVQRIIKHLERTFCAEKPVAPFGYEIVDTRQVDSVLCDESKRSSHGDTDSSLHEAIKSSKPVLLGTHNEEEEEEV